jgi:hypothetical protein
VFSRVNPRHSDELPPLTIPSSRLLEKKTIYWLSDCCFLNATSLSDIRDACAAIATQPEPGACCVPSRSKERRGQRPPGAARTVTLRIATTHSHSMVEGVNTASREFHIGELSEKWTEDASQSWCSLI